MRKLLMILLVLSFCLSSCSQGKTEEVRNDKITAEVEDDKLTDEITEENSSDQTLGSERLTPSGEAGNSSDINIGPDSGNELITDSAEVITECPVTGEAASEDAENIETEVNQPANLPLEGQNRIFVMSDNGFEEITPEGTNEEEAGSKTGEYPKKVANGTEISVDLDNDKKKETVFLDVRGSMSFKVDGEEYGDKNGDGLLDSFEVFPDSPSADGYYITDIDTRITIKRLLFWNMDQVMILTHIFSDIRRISSPTSVECHSSRLRMRIGEVKKNILTEPVRFLVE
jgi:hypothetical protein